MNNKNKTENRKFGDKGEEFVVDFLKDNRWQILEKNYIYKNNLGEVDIIAKKDKIITFIEVKSRKYHFVSPNELVPLSKQKRIIKTAECYIFQKNISLSEYLIRFDIAYYNNGEVSYFENAFQKIDF